MKLTMEVDLSGALFQAPRSDFEIELHWLLGKIEHKIMQQYDREPATVCDTPEDADIVRNFNGQIIGHVRLSKENT